MTTAEEWNDRYPIGTVVNAEPGAKASQGGAVLRTKTRTRAWTLGSGDAVVAVKGYPGGIALTHVNPLPADADDTLARALYEALEWGGCAGARWEVVPEDAKQRWREIAPAVRQLVRTLR